MDKLILDPCCGSRMFWFDKKNPNVVFGDKRTETHELCDGRMLEIKPDIEMDVTNIPFPHNTFYHVVLDLPHLKKGGDKAWIILKYGRLPVNWQEFIKSAFDEGMRVLKPHGTLTFKWNENQIPVKKVIEVLGTQPLYGHTTGRYKQTIWLMFMKINPPHLKQLRGI